MVIMENHPKINVEIPANPTAKMLRFFASRKTAIRDKTATKKSMIPVTNEITPFILIGNLR